MKLCSYNHIKFNKFQTTASPDKSETQSIKRGVNQRGSIRLTESNSRATRLNNVSSAVFQPTPEWVAKWQKKLPLQTIMRLLQVLVPQVEKICIDK